MDAQSLLSQVVRADLPPLDATAPLSTIRGLDSLGMVSLVLKLEATIARELTEAELEALVTVGDVAKLLDGK